MRPVFPPLSVKTGAPSGTGTIDDELEVVEEDVEVEAEVEVGVEVEVETDVEDEAVDSDDSIEDEELVEVSQEASMRSDRHKYNLIFFF